MKKYSRPIVLGIAVLLVGVFVSGALDWYDFFPHIDKVYHFFGGVALGWFFYIYFSFDESHISKFKKVFILVSSACFVAVLWEYAERLSSLYSLHHFPWLFHWFRGGGLNDTLLDILTGMTGSFAFGMLKINQAK